MFYFCTLFVNFITFIVDLGLFTWFISAFAGWLTRNILIQLGASVYSAHNQLQLSENVPGQVQVRSFIDFSFPHSILNTTTKAGKVKTKP